MSTGKPKRVEPDAVTLDAEIDIPLPTAQPKRSVSAATIARTEDLIGTIRVLGSELIQISAGSFPEPLQLDHFADRFESVIWAVPGELANGNGYSLKAELEALAKACRAYDIGQVKLRARHCALGADAVQQGQDDNYATYRGLPPFDRRNEGVRIAPDEPEIVQPTREQHLAARALYDLGGAKCNCTPAPDVQIVGDEARLTYTHSPTCPQANYLKARLADEGLELRS